MASERARRAHELRAAGLTLKAIGQSMGGLSVERSRQLVKQWQRHLDKPEGDGIWSEAERAGLPTRARNALKCAGLYTKKDIREAVRRGAEIDGLGHGGLAVIRKWLRIPEPQPPPVSEKAVRSAITTLERAGYIVK